MIRTIFSRSTRILNLLDEAILCRESGEVEFPEKSREMEYDMRINKNDVPVRIDVPGAVARQVTDFGDAGGYGTIGGEYFSLGAGTDIADLLQGLEDDLCQSPHWGYILEGKLTVSFADGSQERTEAGDLFYWPPGHSVRAEEDTEMILFSPQHEHGRVIEHIAAKVAG